MLSRNQIRHITELRVRKYRAETGRFLAEGHKLAIEMMASRFRIEAVYALAEWITDHGHLATARQIPLLEVLPHEMERITALNTPSPVLLVVHIPEDNEQPWFHPGGAADQLILALDDIRDPGNFGTILRIADWFGIGSVICSERCVDTFNPKVIQATMGSIARVMVHTLDLDDALCSLPAGTAVFGAALEGKPVYDPLLPASGVILIGNESRGIDPVLMKRVTHPVTIPSYGPATLGKAESLNASVAAAIVCAEFRRKLNL